MSDLEDVLAFQMKAAKLPTPDREHRFWPGRRFAFDFAWPAHSYAVEVEGGTYIGGRHTRGKQYASDLVKYNEAALRGWTVLRFDTDMVQSGVALVEIERLFGR